MTNNGFEIPEWVKREDYPFENKWMILDGHRIHYVDEGPRDKPVLLFVHPGPGWSFSYRYQIQASATIFVAWPRTSPVTGYQ